MTDFYCTVPFFFNFNETIHRVSSTAMTPHSENHNPLNHDYLNPSTSLPPF